MPAHGVDYEGIISCSLDPLLSKVCTFHNMGKNTRNSNNDSTSSTEEAVKRVVVAELQKTIQDNTK
ncbi:hypothetical protein L9F63_024658, partial [Diploptera punctata]